MAVAKILIDVKEYERLKKVEQLYNELESKGTKSSVPDTAKHQPSQSETSWDDIKSHIQSVVHSELKKAIGDKSVLPSQQAKHSGTSGQAGGGAALENRDGLSRPVPELTEAITLPPEVIPDKKRKVREKPCEPENWYFLKHKNAHL